MTNPDSFATIEEKVRAVTHMPQPDPQFVETLWGKMEPRANQKLTKAQVWGSSLQNATRYFHTAWQAGTALVGLAVVIGLLVVGIKLLPEGSLHPLPLPAQPTETVPAPTPVKTVAPSPSPIGVPLPVSIPGRLVDGVCNTPVSQAFNGRYLGQANLEYLDRLVGGGQAKSGDFTFELWLACGSAFGRQANLANHSSEIEGLGLLIGWSYQGVTQAGETLDYQGFEPFVRERGSSSGALSAGSFDAMLSGVQFPAGIIPDFSKADAPLRYAIKVQTPAGELAGAALTFTLQRQPEGYRPVDIKIAPLSEAELKYGESPADSKPDFPTLDPETVYPELKPVRELIDRYQDPLRTSPGWLYIKVRHENPPGNSIYGSLTEWTSEAWLQIDAQGYVVTEVQIHRNMDGVVFQQAYSKEGRTHNLTLGSSSRFTPYRLDLGGELYRSLLGQLRSGEPINRKEITIEGRTAWVFAFTDTFPEPASIDSVMTSKLIRSTAIDRQSGAELYSEMVRTLPEGQVELVWRLTYETIERVLQLPDEIQAILHNKEQSE